VLVVLALPATVRAHAFPDHSEPRVGHSVPQSPPEVRVWFDGAIEPVFSTLRVEDANGHQVDRGDAHVDAHDDTLLEVSVPSLPAGAYRAVWSVVARDGHRTEGRFPFNVESP
jgi:methionine-rich copper-binding protein CopC